MDWENIEDRLREDQQAQRHPVDTNALWESVQPHIPQEKKKNRIVFWLWGGLSTAASIALLWFVLGTGNKAPATDFAIDTNMTEAHNQQLEMIVDTYANQNIQDAAFNKVDLEHGIQTPAIGQYVSESNNRPIASSSTGVIDKYDSSAATKNSLNSNSIKINKNNRIIQEQWLLQNSNNQLTEDGSNTSMTDIIPPNANGVIRIIKQGITNIHLSMLPSIGLLTPFIINQDFKLVTPEIAPTKMLHPFKKNRSQWFIELAGGVTTGHGKLSLNKNDFLQALDSRASAERSLLSYSMRAHIGLQLSSAWSITTGINYSNLYKRSVKTIQFSEDLSLDNTVIEEIYSVDGLQVVRGSIDITQQVTRSTRRINSLKSVEIPVTVLHRSNLGAFSIDLGVGIATTIFSRHTGYVHPYDDREYDIALDENDWYKDGLSLSSHFTTGVAFPLSARTELISRLRYQHYFDGINNPSYGIQESASNYHLEIGTRIKL